MLVENWIHWCDRSIYLCANFIRAEISSRYEQGVCFVTKLPYKYNTIAKEQLPVAWSEFESARPWSYTLWHMDPMQTRDMFYLGIKILPNPHISPTFKNSSEGF